MLLQVSVRCYVNVLAPLCHSFLSPCTSGVAADMWLLLIFPLLLTAMCFYHRYDSALSSFPISISITLPFLHVFQFLFVNLFRVIYVSY